MFSYLSKVTLLFSLLLGAVACTARNEPISLTLMTHDSFDISEAVIAEFESQNNVKVAILPAGDAGTMINQAILAQDRPLADVLYGIDNAFMGRALAVDIFEAYQSPALSNVPAGYILDPTYHLLPIDYGDVCLNYDKDWFSSHNLSLPQTLADLTTPAYHGLLVVENPATSSPGLAFLLATIATFGEDGYLDYWQQLRDNDLLVVNDWNEAYYSHFSAAGSGDRPLVISYASSPPAELFFADPPITEPTTASLTQPGTCFRQIEFAGILKGTLHRELARKWLDFMLGDTFQADIPLKMFVFPINPNIPLPDLFTAWAEIPAEPATLSPAAIDSGRDTWIRAWTETVLR